MNNLLITILKYLSINDKGYPFFKNLCFKKLSSSWNFVQLKQILKYHLARVCIKPTFTLVAKNYQNGCHTATGLKTTTT